MQVRGLITGIDEDGKSCVVEDRELADFLTFMPGVGVNLIFETKESPPPARPIGHHDLLPTPSVPGLARWYLVELEPALEIPMHHTDTVDFNVVLSGNVNLVLEDGSHPLGPGDCVVVTGVDHAWHTGADGCRLNMVAIGTPSPLP